MDSGTERVEGWIRKPNIGFSQVGYLPSQPKEAVIELDKNDKVIPQASIWQVKADGTEAEVFKGKTAVWGPYYKYNYVKFDFSEVQEPGIYYIQYGNEKTNNFTISPNVYDHITDATTDVWIPIHMNHMTVNEGTGSGTASLSKKDTCRHRPTPTISTCTGRELPPTLAIRH
mgnify:FL=1